MARPRPLKYLDDDVLASAWARTDISTEKMATALGVSRQSLSSRAKTLGLPPRTGNRNSLKKGLSDERFTEMWTAGVRAKDIASAFGYSLPRSVYARRCRLGLPARARSFFGDGSAGGWSNTISLSAFLEREMVGPLAVIASMESAAMRKNMLVLA
jgi:hypothetical protein